MNYSRAFSYVFEDKNWLSKILIAGLISLIPIVGQIYLFGWMIEIIRRVKAGRSDILPTTHFSYFLTLGLKMFVVSLIYSIPVIIISGILQLLTSSASNADESIFTIFFAGLGCIGGILSLVLNIAVALLGTYGAIKLAETDQIKACLDFNDAFQCIKNNIGAFIIVELLAIVAGLIEAAGAIICVGIIFTIPYGVAIVGNLCGQLWDNLKPYEKASRPFRGSAINRSGDIIEEAPFTRVQDIEKTAEAEAEQFVEEVKDAAEETADETDILISEIAAAEEEPESAQETQEVSEPEEPETETPETEEEKGEEESSEKPDDDLPSFE